MRKYLLTALLAWAGCAVSGLAAADEAALVRGGRLYDDWSRESGNRPPSGRHPAFAGVRADVTPAASWRCSTCHGWDYQGRHGFPGIRARRGGDAAAIAALLRNDTHRYGEVMSDADLHALALFVRQGQPDMAALVAAARSATAAAAGHEKYYATICAACHGADGGRLREVPPIGEAARQRPHEVLHYVIHGHSGGNMPALSALGGDFAARMLAYLQTLPAASRAVSIARGGRLYDDWQAETGAARQALPHPAYPVTAGYANDAPLTWRCKECHGWDYAGAAGHYASGRHATGIKGIRGMAGAAPERIEAILRDATHRYDAVLLKRDLMDLANFVAQGQVDMDAAIDRKSQRARGDAGRARATYRTICAACHGLDGRRVITAVPLGRVARTNPWESLHKIANGHPDEKMPALRELDWQLLVDILAHLQELPEERSR
ncbi:MAG: c-type cytochrome [Pseudomonadota bacterium]